jgi:hypothetical protein
MLDGMNKKCPNSYVIFYPVLSRDGMPFPVNKYLKEIQGPHYRENLAWKGNLVIAKSVTSSSRPSSMRLWRPFLH